MIKSKNFITFVLTAILFLTGACTEELEEPTPQPPTPGKTTGKHQTLTSDMPADASETTVDLRGLSAEVSRKTGSAPWLSTTLLPYTGGTPKVVVACTQNLQVDARQQEVTFIAASDTLVLTVRQVAYAGGASDVSTPNETPTDQPAYSPRR